MDVFDRVPNNLFFSRDSKKTFSDHVGSENVEDRETRLALLRCLFCGRLLCDFALWSDFALRDLLGLLFCCHMKEKELRPA